MEWVEGSKIYDAVQQTYYDRRIRELRESGWQIETHPSGKMYRLRSHKKLPGNVRRYPTAKQKREVWERDEGTCQICRLPDDHMQYDHKVPLERHGPTEVDNLQLVCRSCNVEKREPVNVVDCRLVMVALTLIQNLLAQDWFCFLTQIPLQNYAPTQKQKASLIPQLLWIYLRNTSKRLSGITNPLAYKSQ